MPVYNVQNTTYPLQNNSSILIDTITDSFFGGNFLIHQNPPAGQTPTYIAALEGLGLRNLRYPGGTITEQAFSMQNPNATTSSQGPLIPQNEFLTHAAALDATVTIVLPTRTAFTADAWTALTNGTYGTRTIAANYDDIVRAYVKDTLVAAAAAGTTISAIEIGNEFWLGAQMTAAEYGRVANVALKAAQAGINDAIALGAVTAANQPDLVVQGIHAEGMFSPNGANQVWLVNGVIVEDDPGIPGTPTATIPDQGPAYGQLSALVAGIDATARALIDGIVDHYYADDGLTGGPNGVGMDGNHQFIFSQMDRFETLLGLSHGTLDRYLTEWNVQKDAPERGMAQVAVMLDQVYEMATHGITAANVWPLWFENANGTSLLNSADFTQRVPGAIFMLMQESMVGTAALFDYDSAPGAAIGAGARLDVHGYASASKLVMFAANLSSASANNVDLELNGIGDATLQAKLDTGPYFMVQTQLEATLGGLPNPGLAGEDVIPVITVGNGGMFTGDNVTFTGLDPYGVVRIEITYVTTGNDRIEGRSGNDVIEGRGGSDTIIGDAGNDLLQGEDGTDLLRGNDGNDTINGGNQNDTIYGDDGDDSLSGGNGDNDVLYGGGGNDQFGGGTGNDSLYGGGGTDTAVFLGAFATTVNLSSGTATGGLGSDLLSSIENVITGTLADNITGSTAANDLNASDGNDTLSGGDGNDTLRGGNGNDSMLGGNGNDSMIGGSGADTLAGNAGNDVFVFNGTADFGDRITDFSAVSGNDDGFAFSGLGSGLTAGVLAATRFRTATTNAAGDSDDRFIFRTTDKTLWFDADGTGAGGPLLVATLTIGSVTAADILIL